MICISDIALLKDDADVMLEVVMVIGLLKVAIFTSIGVDVCDGDGSICLYK